LNSYPFVFLLNLSVEYAILLAILSAKFWKRIFVMALLLNLATHPLLWWILPRIPGTWLINLLIAELFVFGVEIGLGMMFFRAHYSRARVITAVAAANLATFLMTFAL
jgi:hypothetical protein